MQEDDSWADGSTAIEDSDEFISAEDAVPLVRDMSVATTAPPGVENIVWQRISEWAPDLGYRRSLLITS